MRSRMPQASSRQPLGMLGLPHLRYSVRCRFGHLNERKVSIFAPLRPGPDPGDYGAKLMDAANVLKSKGISGLCRDSNPFGGGWHLCCDNSARTPPGIQADSEEFS